MPENLTDSDQLNSTKKKIPFQNFLEQVDNTGELLENASSTLDDVKQQRCVRAEMVTRSMDEIRYLKYSKARRVSFANKNRHKFSDWVCADGNVAFNTIFNILVCSVLIHRVYISQITGDITLSKQAYTILSYLAYETVAQIIDLAFLVRQDQSKIHGDPIDRQRLSYVNPFTYKPYITSHYYHGKVCIAVFENYK